MYRSARAGAAALAAVGTASLSELCTVPKIQSALPSNGTLQGIELLPSTVTASIANTADSSGGLGGIMGGGSSSANYTYCNVTLAYAHTGKDDTVNLKLAFPSPGDFENRFYMAGGMGYTLSTDVTSGLQYGAASGATDGGYDAFDQSFDQAILLANGSINWDAARMFGYQALGETTVIGKAITKSLYSADRIYSYFQGCSDGGREAMSQVQRWGDEYDGVIAGAPAFRYAQQQVNHVYAATVERTQGYYPPPCELAKIVNATIAACDPLDGRTDGVISRTDLCKLNFDLRSTIGEPYCCAAQNSTSLGFGFSKRQITTGSSSSYQPAQNGTVSAKAVAVAQAIYDGLHSSEGKRAYLDYQVGAEFTDAATTYDSATNSWQLSIPSTGGEFVTRFVQLVDKDNLENLDGVTYDTLIQWMNVAYNRYLDTLQTTVPDLKAFKSAGGKLIHYHGESDPSVPAGSSVHYFDSVRTTMYPEQRYNESVDALADWYRLFLIPGAAHCGTNSLQPGPWPVSLMDTLISWVEGGNAPDRLNSTVSSGDYAGESQQLCKWPMRPVWDAENSFDCVYDQASIDSWTYTFNAFNVTVY